MKKKNTYNIISRERERGRMTNFIFLYSWYEIVTFTNNNYNRTPEDETFPRLLLFTHSNYSSKCFYESYEYELWSENNIYELLTNAREYNIQITSETKQKKKLRRMKNNNPYSEWGERGYHDDDRSFNKNKNTHITPHSCRELKNKKNPIFLCDLF
jgi:hypothetical protein